MNLGRALQNDRNIVLEAVKHDGDALRYASDELKNDRNFVLEAVKNDGGALRYASEEVRRDLVNGFPLEEVTSNEIVVFEAVKQNGLALQHASVELKSNYKIVLEAVKTNNMALKFASLELRNNTNVIIEAACQNQGYYSPDNSGCVMFNSLITNIQVHVRKVQNVLIPLKYTFLSTILYGLSVCYKKKKENQANGKTKTADSSTQHSLYISCNSLQQLNKLGSYGVLDFKKEVADYLGVHFSLKVMKQAVRGLEYDAWRECEVLYSYAP